MKTAESDGVEVVGAWFTKVVAARVISAEAIPNSKNVKAEVDAGALGQKTVVCGALNCRAGIVTAYVPAGTSLDGREIGKAGISGGASEGMLAGGYQIGVNREHDGILELDLEPGEFLACKPDYIIAIDKHSLTHRPDSR